MEGTLEVAQSHKVPLFVRIIAGLIVVIIYGGLIFLGGALTVSGYSKQDWPLAIVGVVMVVLFVVFLFVIWKKHKKRELIRK